MIVSSAPSRWEDLAVGQRAELPICIDQGDMETYARLSGDRSTVHHDKDYARALGFREPIVYGGLLVAAVSRMVGMILPGPIGVAAGWRIDFHSPLYVDERATLSGEVSQLSDAMRLVKLKFSIEADGRLIAKGSAEAKVIV